MSLVAYGNSDDDSDEYDLSEETEKTQVKVNELTTTTASIATTKASASTSSTLTPKLPTPKKQTTNSVIEEEDDEFLHKKAVATSEQPPKPVKRTKVQITIPALPKVDESEKVPKKFIGALPSKSTGLLNLLPKPNFGNFKKSTTNATTSANSSTATKTKESNGFIPHSVAKLGNAATKKPIKPIPTNVEENSDSDSSDDGDFFSFHSENKLPEVSQQEINAMVAKKAAEMRTATPNYLQNMEQQKPKYIDMDEQEIVPEESQIDEEAMKALCGAKRARRGDGPSVVIELSGDEVLPNRDEWLRNQLQSTTEHQPRGMVDEEPAADTKKKHHITYLAHQAKANEQELQAMWAANRHTRRQTQNKYGF